MDHLPGGFAARQFVIHLAHPLEVAAVGFLNVSVGGRIIARTFLRDQLSGNGHR